MNPSDPDPQIPEQSTVSSPSPETIAAAKAALDCYECRTCGYVYEPQKGDNRSKVPAKTAFIDLAKTWRCPVCGAPKVQFDNIGPKNKPSGFEENLGYGLGVNTLTPGQKNILIFGALALAFLFFMSLYGLK